MGDTMTPREKLDKARAQALKEYMGATASARKTRTRRKNRAEALYEEAIKPAREEHIRKWFAALDEFGLESAKKE